MQHLARMTLHCVAAKLEPQLVSEAKSFFDPLLPLLNIFYVCRNYACLNTDTPFNKAGEGAR